MAWSMITNSESDQLHPPRPSGEKTSTKGSRNIKSAQIDICGTEMLRRCFSAVRLPIPLDIHSGHEAL
jgi:hypothetical protein